MFKDLIVPSDGKRPNCDYKDRSAIAGSLEFLRLTQVCKVVEGLVDQKSTLENITDSNGRAVFHNVKILRAPQGNYGLRYELETLREGKTLKILSDELPTFLNSKVAKMKVHPPYSPQVAETRVAFIDQPVIQLFDMEGNPV